jgi:hypothetical protein
MATAMTLAVLFAITTIALPASAQERSLGRESVSVVRSTPAAPVAAQSKPRAEGMPHGVFKVEKRVCPAPRATCDEVKPYETKESVNAYTNTGGALLLDLLIGAGGTNFSSANAYMGVGDSSTATTATMTDLQAATNKVRVAMSSAARAGQVLTFTATFGSGSANFQWNECAVFNASSGGTMLARAAQSMGTKASGTSWTLTYTITVP